MYKFIDANKEHLHTLDDKPLIGTTTLLKEVHPPMLSWYGSGSIGDFRLAQGNRIHRRRAAKICRWAVAKTSRNASARFSRFA